MRRIAMSGLVAVAAVLGSAVPAVTASAATTGTATAPVPAVARLATSARIPTEARSRADISVAVSSVGSRISCGSPTACLAVGTNTNNSSDSESIPVAEALHGTAWKSVAVKAPRATATALTGVSCKSATYCLVIGGYSDKAANTHPIAWTWNGTALTPLVALPLPSADSLIELSAVSCVAVKSCVVIGSAFGSGADSVQLIWTWNGSKWALKAAAMAGNAADAELTAAHCFSLTSCVVAGVGSSASATTFAQNLVLATWNGKTLTPQTAAAPAGFGLGIVTDLSCSSARSCAAVGASINIGTSEKNTTMFGFAEVWNGKTWTATKWTGPKGITLAGLFGVSCTSATSCVAVGVEGTQTAGTATSLIFNGTKWSVVKAPSVGKGLVSDFEGVSCPKAGTCIAIGEYGKSTAPNGKPLAGYWSGKSWKIKAA